MSPGPTIVVFDSQGGTFGAENDSHLILHPSAQGVGQKHGLRKGGRPRKEKGKINSKGAISFK
jgi:hypothetical protein